MQSSKFLHLGTDKSVVTTTKIKREQNRVILHTHTTHSEKNTVIHMLTTTSTLSSSLATSSSSSRLLSRTDAKKRHHQRQRRRQHSSPSAFASSLSKTNFATRTTKAGVFNASTTRTAQNENINSSSAALQRTKKKKSLVVTFASAAADGAAAPPVGTFTIGIAWFFMHQIIGVANDVIMKAAG